MRCHFFANDKARTGGPIHASLLRPVESSTRLVYPRALCRILSATRLFSSQSSDDYDYLTHRFGAFVPADGSFMRSRTIAQLGLAN